MSAAIRHLPLRLPADSSALAITTPMVRLAIGMLEGDALPQRTLAGWQAQGIVTPSVRWDRVRGRAHPCLWSLDDLARVRLVVRLRRQGRLGMERVRAVLASYEHELRDALQPDSRVVLVVDPTLGVSLRDRDALERNVETGQYRLPLASMFDGAAQVMARLAA